MLDMRSEPHERQGSVAASTPLPGYTSSSVILIDWKRFGAVSSRRLVFCLLVRRLYVSVKSRDVFSSPLLSTPLRHRAKLLSTSPKSVAMTPRTSWNNLPPETTNSTIRSRYWDRNNNSPWPKRPCSPARPSSHGSMPREARSSPAAPTHPANRQQFKRTYEDAFDFRPKDAVGVKQEPQDESSPSRALKLTRHFAVSKSSKRSTPAIPGKDISVAPKSTESARTPNANATNSRERSAVVATLAHVRDSAVTEAVVAHVLRWARQYAITGHGDVYDTAFIQSIFADLDAHGIEPGRRAIVTDMLTRPLQQQLERLRSSSESLRSCLASINTPQPSSPLSRSSRPAD
jgi:hypothetical protein